LGLPVPGADDCPAPSAGPGNSRSSARPIVRPVTGDDGPAFVVLAKESVQFHRKWIKLPTDLDAFQRYLSRFDGENAFCFVVCAADSDSITGFVSLTGIEREPYERGRLGYGVFARYARMGYLSSGLKYVIDLAFESLKLHRLEADIQPGNDPSKRLIKRAGFRCEGVSPQFIRINDEWIDHERWALTLDEWLRVSRRYS